MEKDMKQLIYFTIDDNPIFKQMLEVCLESIRKNCDVSNIEARIMGIPKGATRADVMCYRNYVNDKIDIDRYLQVWFMDVDILVKGDIFSKYRHCDSIVVSKEYYTTIGQQREWLGHHLSDETFEQVKDLPGVNAGFLMVPRRYYKMFEEKKALTIARRERYPDEQQAEQCALNKLYFESDKYQWMEFTSKDLGFPPYGEDAMVLHYNILRDEMDKLNAMLKNA